MTTQIAPENPQLQAILMALSETEPKTMYEVAEELGLTYWGVYNYFRRLEDLGMITPGTFRRDKKKTFVRSNLSKTPRLHLQGHDRPGIPLYRIATGAPVARKNRTETGTLVDNFPYMALRLYAIASSHQMGHDFDRKAFMEVRQDMVGLRNRLENMIGAINELLAHPTMSGNGATIVDCLLNDLDNPLDRDTIHELMKEAQ